MEKEEIHTFNTLKGIIRIIVNEMDRLKLQHLEQLRDIYDQTETATILIGMPVIKKAAKTLKVSTSM
ncbi:AAA family ATPase [Domibacillus robiginosus]|uniref:AAA family ATPase n=1 Tax=Domibacillus robiginosus TaxID=1071054 RepID=UPI00067C8E8B